MNAEIQKLHNVWAETRNKALENTVLPHHNFDDLANSIVNLGPFYYYVIDFYDMSLSHVNKSITEMHGFDPETVIFNDILSIIHPEDVDFVGKTEAAISDLFYSNLGPDKLLKYKASYSFRAKMRDGKYALMNHQSLMLTLDSKGRYAKSLNIHTRIDHLSDRNTYQFSLIGLQDEPSYLNLNTSSGVQTMANFSKREIEIIKCLGEGLNNKETGEKLFISEQTVKQHRKNIMQKSQSKNTAQLIKSCILQGLI
ncbi:LuxR C-terminal-related transcriptional regulator [Pedobacter sp. PWIIR3]